MTIIEAARPPANGSIAEDTPANGKPAAGWLAHGTPAEDTNAYGAPADGRPTDDAPTDGGPAGGRPAHGGRASDGLAADGRAAPEPHRTSPLVRQGRVVALAVGAFLVPWCVLLGLTLPTAAVAQHWSLAWAGLDGAEAVAALATAVLLGRGDPRAGLTAVTGGTLLLADAWFDVCTSAPGLDHGVAVAEAFCLELPLAGLAFWLALRLTRGTAGARPDQAPNGG